MDLLGCCESQHGLGISVWRGTGRMGRCPEHLLGTETEHWGWLGILQHLHRRPRVPGLAFPPLLSSGLQNSCKKSSSLS